MASVVTSYNAKDDKVAENNNIRTTRCALYSVYRVALSQLSNNIIVARNLNSNREKTRTYLPGASGKRIAINWRVIRTLKFA